MSIFNSRDLATFALLLSCVSLGCASDDGKTTFDNVCEEAAHHYEECLGEAVTASMCDAEAASKADSVLGMSCDELRNAADKSDGFLCDALGIECNSDEPIFSGPACKTDDECSSSESCIENHCFGGVDSDEFHAALDNLFGSTMVPGNGAQVLIDATEGRELRNDLIRNAEDHIHVIALLLEDNEIGRETAQLLVEAEARGVDVRVVFDATSQFTFGSYDILEFMADGGVDVIPYNAIIEWAGVRILLGLSPNERIHEKAMIVDGKDAVVGGRNIGSNYMAADKWRDTDVYLTGPVVEEVQNMFLRDWDDFSEWEKLALCPNRNNFGFYCPPNDDKLLGDPAFYPPLKAQGDASVRWVHHNPREKAPADGYVSYVSLVRGARKSLKINAAYFIPPRRLRNHLKAAAQRGVEVTILTNSRTSNDSEELWFASLNYYDELISSGVRIFEWRGTETNHAKTMIVDDVVGVIGSYNMDPRSAVSNSESLAIIEDDGAVKALVDVWPEDLDKCDEADADFTDEEKLKMGLFRLAEPLF